MTAGSAAPRVSVIVPAAASPERLLACLGALARHGPLAIPFEIIVVWNGGASRPEPPALPIDGVRLVTPGVNLGLAGAGNAGRRLARGEYLVLLHDDAEIEPGWLEALVETADRHAEAGAVGGKVLHPDGSLQSAGMVLWRDATTAPPWAGAPPPAAAFERRRAVDYCGTSSLLVRAASWDAAGGLDERFFPAYYVDVDLCMSLRRLGQIVLYEPRSSILHHRGASADRRFREFVTRRNREQFVAKWRRELESHEPAPVGPMATPASAVAVERALARAEESAARLCHAGGAGQAMPPAERPARSARVANAPPQPAPQPIVDPEGRDRRRVELDLALHRAYARHLAAALDEALAAGAGCAADLAAERRRIAALEQAAAELPELRARAATLSAIESGRWWRLYLRLLPLLRRLRR